MATWTRGGKGAKKSKKIRPKVNLWRHSSGRITPNAQYKHTRWPKGKRAIIVPLVVFSPFSGCFLFVVSLTLVSVVQDSVTRGSGGWFFFILERSRNYIFNRNLFTKFFYFSFYKILTLLFLSKESEGSWVGRYFFEVPRRQGLFQEVPTSTRNLQ